MIWFNILEQNFQACLCGYQCWICVLVTTLGFVLAYILLSKGLCCNSWTTNSLLSFPQNIFYSYSCDSPWQSGKVIWVIVQVIASCSPSGCDTFLRSEISELSSFTADLSIPRALEALPHFLAHFIDENLLISADQKEMLPVRKQNHTKTQQTTIFYFQNSSTNHLGGKGSN